MTTDTYSISVSSGSRTLVTCDHFSVASNCVTFLFGESGIGKSILCKALYGLLDPDQLDVQINGRPYVQHLRTAWTKTIFANSFFVFQEPSSHLNPLIRIRDQLSEGALSAYSGGFTALKSLWQDTNDAAISKITSLFPKPYRPSGGEKQRILLAMAFEKIDLFLQTQNSGQPSLFVFDEPTGSLDNNYRDLFLRKLLEKYSQRPFTILFITHDYSIISQIYKCHPDLLPSICFKELTRTSETGSTQLNDFSTEAYLQWLGAVSPPRSQPDGGKDRVLTVEPVFSIFGREHRICRDPARTQETPLIINSGEMVYVKAASGVGKTTLAKIIMGLYKPDSFSMNLCGITVDHKTPASVWPRCIWGAKAGMVFQHADEALDLAADIQETFQGLPSKAVFGLKELQAILSQLFDPANLTPAFLKRKVAYLSGGQKQRLNLLRTLALATNLIILDEPLNGLDFRGVTRVLGLLEEKRKNGGALLLISHNEEIFEAIIDPAHTFYLS